MGKFLDLRGKSVCHVAASNHPIVRHQKPSVGLWPNRLVALEVRGLPHQPSHFVPTREWRTIRAHAMIRNMPSTARLTGNIGKPEPAAAGLENASVYSPGSTYGRTASSSEAAMSIAGLGG